MASQPALTDWNSDLLYCCEGGCGNCCFELWCCPCLACKSSRRFGENLCLPLCDIFSPALFIFFEIPLFAPPAGLSLRAGMRRQFGIKGSFCQDIAVSCFCMWCNWCQMHRELKYRKRSPTIINVSNKAVISQPPPVMNMNQDQAQPYEVGHQ